MAQNRPGRQRLESGVRMPSRAMTAIVKGFRMPAGRRRAGMHGGRRPKSLEGGNRGGVRTDAGVDLWDSGAVCAVIFRFSNTDDGWVITAALVLVAVCRIGRVVLS